MLTRALPRATANDNEAPESWLAYTGSVKLLCGRNAHRRWHYTGPAGQPRRFVRWYVRSVDAPKPETLENAWHSLVSWVTGRKTPWELEAEEAAEDAAVAKLRDGKPADAGEDEGSDDARSVSSSVASAMELRHRKRRLTVMGLAGVYAVWAIFAWFIFTCASCAARIACAAPAMLTAPLAPRRRHAGVQAAG